ncbi:MAG: DUF1295 domain-containing protein [Clostridia bacterium]|nr:DUF1295 domain-containing protein [Clostridia bacterium]
MLTVTHRGKSFLIVTAVYLAAAAVGLGVYLWLPPWLLLPRLLFADAAATVFVFLFSLLFGNASVYDPYWSVQPPVILTALAVATGRPLTLGAALILLAVWLWGIRLTANWAYTFHGLGHQDWRYTMLSEKTGRLYPFVNFAGIHMFPTVVVFFAILPAAYAILEGGEANALTVLGVALSLGATALQAVADVEMQSHRKSGRGGFIRQGLWRYSRHPNYLGEILMWWGVALASLSLLDGRLYLLTGAVLNTVMFLVVSIPMADRRQAKKEGYAEYRAHTRHLLPIPKK